MIINDGYVEKYLITISVFILVAYFINIYLAIVIGIIMIIWFRVLDFL